MPLSEKFIGKYMRMAKQLGEDGNSCYSRQIGVVLVRVYPDGTSRILGTGYNSPPAKTPHCDSREYLENIVWPQTTAEDRETLFEKMEASDRSQTLFDGAGSDLEVFLRYATGCKQCPRRLLGAKSGERTEICSCEHAERNAIVNACSDLHGAILFGWCGLACWDCAKLMCQAGIAEAYFVDDGSYARHGSDYSFGVRWLFEQKGLVYHINRPEVYLS